MQDYVSTRWIRLAGLVAVVWVVWTDFIPYRLPWPVVAWAALAFSAALWVRLTWPRSLAQVIADVEAEPARAGVRPVRAAIPAPTLVLRVDRKGMAK
jgi:hypothetical protein